MDLAKRLLIFRMLTGRSEQDDNEAKPVEVMDNFLPGGSSF